MDAKGYEAAHGGARARQSARCDRRAMSARDAAAPRARAGAAGTVRAAARRQRRRRDRRRRSTRRARTAIARADAAYFAASCGAASAANTTRCCRRSRPRRSQARRARADRARAARDRRVGARASARHSVSRRHQRGGRAREGVRRHRRPQVRQRRARQARAASCARPRCARRRAMNEFELIERYFRRAPRNADVRIGIGDDGAVIAPAPGMEYVVSVDMLVEGRHFAAGRRSAARSATRRWRSTCRISRRWARCRASCCSPARCRRPIRHGSPRSCAASTRSRAQYDVELIGGDTTRGPRTLCVTAIGELPAGTALTRARREPGRRVYVSGTARRRGAGARRADGRTDVDAARAGQRCERRLERAATARRARRRAARRRVVGARRLRRADRRPRSRPRRVARRRDARSRRDSCCDELRAMLRGPRARPRARLPARRRRRLRAVLHRAARDARARRSDSRSRSALPLTPIGAITVDPALDDPRRARATRCRRCRARSTISR